MAGNREQEAETGREKNAERNETPRIDQEQMLGTVYVQAAAHRGTRFLPFFAKRKRAGERLRAVPAGEKMKRQGKRPGAW